MKNVSDSEMNNFLFILIYLVFTFHSMKALSDSCEITFSDDSVKLFFLNPKNIKKYQGSDGQLRFVEDYFPKYSMVTILKKCHLY